MKRPEFFAEGVFLAWGGLVLDTAALNSWSDINSIYNDDNKYVNDDNDKCETCESDDDYSLIDNPADDQNGLYEYDHFTFYVFPPYI